MGDKYCTDCVHFEVCYMCTPPLPVCDSYLELVRCKDCKHQQKAFHPDKRMKSGGYWIYGCARNQDQFVAHTVDGEDDDFCSHGERKDNG